MLKVIALVIFAQHPATGAVIVQPGGLFEAEQECVAKAESFLRTPFSVPGTPS